MKQDLTIRYNPPSKYEIAPYGEIYKVMGENESYELFVQCSSNLDAPEWKPVSLVLMDAFKPFISSILLSHCLALSSGKPEDRVGHLNQIKNLLVP
jgi:hypothetical protein